MTEDVFMKLIMFGMVAFIIGMGIKRLLGKNPKFLAKFTQLPSKGNTHSIKDLLSFMVKNIETRRRLLITIGILVGIQVLYFVPLAGVDVNALRGFFKNIAQASGGSTLQLYLGGPFGKLSLSALSIAPFISACLLLQLASIAIPAIRNAAFGGEKGRQKLVKYSYILATILALIQSYFLSQWLQNPSHFAGLNLVTLDPLLFTIITMASLTGMVLFLLFLANLISRYGLGNGIAMIVISGILMRSLVAIPQLITMYTSNQASLFSVIALLAIFIGFLYFAFLFTNRDKIITIKSDTSGKESEIRLRVNWVGKVPIIITKTIYLLPATIAGFVSSAAIKNFANALIMNVWLSVVIQTILILFLTYLYAVVIFKPSKVLDLLSKYNFSLNLKEGEDPKGYLDNNLSGVLIITFVMLFLASGLPSMISPLFKMPYLVASFMGGTTVLILTGVFSDILRQLEFFYKKGETKDLEVAYVALDEIEATVKSEYLKSNNINALVEPIRFTWGMPIRTAIDQYRIYAPSDKVKDARELLK